MEFLSQPKTCALIYPDKAEQRGNPTDLCRFRLLCWVSSRIRPSICTLMTDEASTKTIQSQLKELLPPDYGENWRKYHPSNDALMYSRFDCLRRCKKGRISKEKRSSLRNFSQFQIAGASSKRFRSFEGPARAFKNYANSFEGKHIVLSQGLADSQLVDPSLLLLDGSSLSSHWSNEPNSSYMKCETQIRNHSSYPGTSKPDISALTFISSTNSTLLFNAPNTIPSNPSSITPKSLFKQNDLSENQNLIPEEVLDGEGTLQESDRSASSHGELSKRSTTFDILRRRMTEKSYPESYLKHVSAVYRWSSSNSWRSSLTSISSYASSLPPKIPPEATNTMVGEPSKETATGQSPRPSRKFRIRHLFQSAELSSDEQKIWNELVDEKRLDPESVSRPSYPPASLLNRYCCSNNNKASSAALHSSAICEVCGFSPEHRRANKVSDTYYINLSRINQLDFYGNTPLHCAAASVEGDEFWKLRRLVQAGAHVSICNTFGETFLHVLCNRPGAYKTSDILALLEDLSKVNFPFSKQDYHGRTFLHNYFRGRKCPWDLPFSKSFLSKLFSVTKSNLEIRDNSGEDLRTTILKEAMAPETNDFISRKVLEKLLSSFCPSGNQSIRYLSLLARIKTEEEFESWLEESVGRYSRPITWIDDAGDTLLTGILKARRSSIAKDIVEDLSLGAIVHRVLDKGADIHMRDRNGDTALAIAARRGFRPVVMLLLKEGANVHSRDYQGFAILSQVERHMTLAGGDGKLWSMIWSCHIALVDAGAKSDPSDEDEWMLSLAERQDIQNRRQILTRNETEAAFVEPDESEMWYFSPSTLKNGFWCPS